MAIQYHIHCDEGDVAHYVLLPGDPGRVEVIAQTWDEARRVASNREYVTYTGVYKGAPISCTSTGIGAPSTAIAIEELARCGVTTFLRVGTCGTFMDDIPNGTIAIVDSALRFDGTSRLYAPLEYPAVANYEVLNACIETAKSQGVLHRVGACRSADTFYARHPRPGSSFNNFWQSDWENHFQDMKRLNVAFSEMESGIILVLSKIWGLRAGAMAVVVDNVLKVTGETGKFDPEKDLDHSTDNIKRLALIGNETIRLLYQRDKEKASL